jgi:hypothetical protein
MMESRRKATKYLGKKMALCSDFDITDDDEFPKAAQARRTSGNRLPARSGHGLQLDQVRANRRPALRGPRAPSIRRRPDHQLEVLVVGDLDLADHLEVGRWTGALSAHLARILSGAPACHQRLSARSRRGSPQGWPQRRLVPTSSKEKPALEAGFHVWARQDSNLRPTDYESSAQSLGVLAGARAAPCNRPLTSQAPAVWGSGILANLQAYRPVAVDAALRLPPLEFEL